MTRYQYNPLKLLDTDFKLGDVCAWDKKVQQVHAARRAQKAKWPNAKPIKRGLSDMIFLQPTTDLRLVKTVYSDAELFGRISEDGVQALDFHVDPNALYLVMHTEKNQIAGIAQFEEINDTTLLGHCNVLKNYREKYAQFVGYALIAWFAWDAPEHFKKLQVVIPVCYPDVIGFVKKHGLINEGTRRKSIKKNGVLYDEWLGGITRDEAEHWLKQQHIKAVG